MTDHVSLAESSTTDRRAATRWFALLGAALAWLAHLLGASLISEWGCFAGWGREQLLGISAVAWGILGLTVVTLLVALSALWVSYQHLLRAHRTESRLVTSQESEALFAQVGFWANALFVFIILAESIPILYFLTEC